jgi:Fe2+ or Zn2+ uptake regulation protein
MDYPLIEQALKQHHLSFTKTRKQIYDVLSRNEPLSMPELLLTLPSMDKTTVYRNIELFERIGVVQRLQIGWKYKIELTNEFQDHHHHVTCLVCGQTTALPEDTLLEQRLHDLTAAQGFAPENHQIEVTGTCKNCRKT